MIRNKPIYPLIGTSTPYFVPRGQNPTLVRAGKDYFIIQIHGAQVAFKGSIWQRVKNLVVTTQVNLDHPLLGEGSLKAIQHTRKVEPNHAEQLGLRSNLVKMVPAVMTRVNLSVEFILDKENTLRNLSDLINNGDFLATISLATGTAIVAKTVSSLAGKIIDAFIPKEERDPILNFAGDFNLATEESIAEGKDFLKDGYYVIFGTCDESNPLPKGRPKLEVKEGKVFLEGNQVTQLSYVIIGVYRSPVRTRDLNEGATWNIKLREAESEAELIGNDPLYNEVERKSAWERCRNLLKEAQILILNDPNYLRGEAENIFKASFSTCLEKLNIQAQKSVSPIIRASRGHWQPDLPAEYSMFGIPTEENLNSTLDIYQKQVTEAQNMLRSIGM
jgi:hypothetical protein